MQCHAAQALDRDIDAPLSDGWMRMRGNAQRIPYSPLSSPLWLVPGQKFHICKLIAIVNLRWQNCCKHG